MLPAFDTLEYARRLRDSGFSEEQAEGSARALAAAMTDSIATKQDLHDLEVRLNAKFEIVDARFVELEKRSEARLDARLADLERRLTLRLGAMMVAGIGVVSALVKAL